MLSKKAKMGTYSTFVGDTVLTATKIAQHTVLYIRERERERERERVCVCVYAHGHVHTLDHAQLFLTPWTVAQRIFLTQDRTCVS